MRLSSRGNFCVIAIALLTSAIPHVLVAGAKGGGGGNDNIDLSSIKGDGDNQGTTTGSHGTGGGGGDSPPPGSGDQGTHGTASQSTNPLTAQQQKQQQQANDELRERVLDAAKDLIEKILDAIRDAAGSSSTSSINIATAVDQSQSSATSTPALGAGNDGSLPSIDMAREVGERYTLSPWNDSFTSDEYEMYQNHPLCFYANLEYMYSSAYASASSSAADSLATTAPTRKFRDRREDDSSSMTDHLLSLFGTQIPRDISSIHFGTPTASNNFPVTSTAISTTVCSSLDGVAVTTQYLELKTALYNQGAGTTGTASAIRANGLTLASFAVAGVAAMFML